MRLTSSRPHALFGTPALFGLCLLLCSASLGAADLEDELAAMTPTDAFDYGQELLNDGKEQQAMKVFKFIADVHPDEVNVATWALYTMERIAGRHGRIDEAIGYLQRILDQYPDSGIVTRGYVAGHMANYLIFSKGKYQEAIDIAKSTLERGGDNMKPFEQARLIERLALANTKLGNYAAAQQELRAWLPTCLYLLTYRDYYDTTMRIQLAQKEFDAALSTARAGYALCDFDVKAVKDMADLVRRAFIAKGEMHKGIQFLAAQDDADKPNPLHDVPMPTVTEEQKQQLFEAAGDDPVAFIHVCVYTGDNARALSRAVIYMAEAPIDDAVTSMMEVARVLKATDLNMVRANQFINYARTGEGENPLADVDI